MTLIEFAAAVGALGVLGTWFAWLISVKYGVSGAKGDIERVGRDVREARKEQRGFNEEQRAHNARQLEAMSALGTRVAVVEEKVKDL